MLNSSIIRGGYKPVTRWPHLVIRLTCGLQLVAVPQIAMCTANGSNILKPISAGMIATPLPKKQSAQAL